MAINYEEIQTQRQGILDSLGALGDIAGLFGADEMSQLWEKYTAQGMYEQAKAIAASNERIVPQESVLAQEYKSQALSDVESQFAREKEMTERQNARLGIDPSSGRAQSMELERSLHLAAARAGALTESNLRAKKESRQEQQAEEARIMSQAIDLTKAGTNAQLGLIRTGLEGQSQEIKSKLAIEQARAGILGQQGQEFLAEKGMEQKDRLTEMEIAAGEQEWRAKLEQQRLLEEARRAESARQFDQEMALGYKQLETEKELANQKLEMARQEMQARTSSSSSRSTRYASVGGRHNPWTQLNIERELAQKQQLIDLARSRR